MEIGSLKLESLMLANTRSYEQAIQLSILHMRSNETFEC